MLRMAPNSSRTCTCWVSGALASVSRKRGIIGRL